jgi:hypothetical protein
MFSGKRGREMRVFARARGVFANTLLVTLLVTGVVLVGAAPASARDNSATYHNCTVTAHDPIEPSLGTAKAIGDVTCNNLHVLSLTVYLELYSHGKWVTADNGNAKNTVSTRSGYGLGTSASGDCTRSTSQYRTRSKASIDGTTVDVHTVVDYLLCPY